MMPNEQRAIAIRDAAKRILKRDLDLEKPHREHGLVYSWEWSRDDIRISYRTRPDRGNAALIVATIDIRIHRHKVMSLEWTMYGFEIAIFKPGSWEDKILNHAQD